MNIEKMHHLLAKRRLGYWRALNGQMPLDGCYHRRERPETVDRNLQAVMDEAGKVSLWCDGCMADTYMEHIYTGCDSCGTVMARHEAWGWLEDFVIEDRERVAVEGYLGTVTAALAQLCQRCVRAEDLVKVWQLGASDSLVTGIRDASPLPIAEPMSAERDGDTRVGYICGLHPETGIRHDVQLGMCLLDHAVVTRCSICGAPDGFMQERMGRLVVEQDAYLTAVGWDGESATIWGTIIIEPLAYLCQACATGWAANEIPTYRVRASAVPGPLGV